MRGSALAALLAAGCLQAPPGAEGDPTPDAGAARIDCEEADTCPGDPEEVACHCGTCAAVDLDCPPSGLRYLDPQGGTAECVPSPDELAVGFELSCVKWSNGRVSCWGSNCWGELGDGTGGGCTDGSLYSVRPRLVRASADGPPFGDVKALAAGFRHVCAMRGDGTVWCWGDNASGKLGDGSSAGSRSTPVQVVRTDNSPLSNIALLAAGGHHTCAADTGGVVGCWGDNSYLQLGVEGLPERNTAEPTEDELGWMSLTGGGAHTCGNRMDAAKTIRLWCWGRNAWGQLGNDMIAEPGLSVPDKVVYESNPAEPLGAPAGTGLGNRFSCSGAAGRTVYCWGQNLRHSLGDEDPPVGGNGVDAEAARKIALDPPVAPAGVTAGDDFACVRLADDQVYCWGGNDFGQLGIGGESTPQAPARLELSAVDIEAGLDHVCAITPERAVVCWGNNTRGQLGDGTVLRRPSPTPVVELCP